MGISMGLLSESQKKASNFAVICGHQEEQAQQGMKLRTDQTTVNTPEGLKLAQLGLSCECPDLCSAY